MSMKMLKVLTILLPPLLIGGFEYVRHDYLLESLSMEVGNVYITLLTLLLSYLFATWMFRRIEAMNLRLAREQSRHAVYEERERLARELHDNIAQTLFFLNVQLKKGQLEEARSAVSEIDHHLRQAIFNLRTLPEESATFVARLQTWLEEWSVLTGIGVEHRIDMEGGALPPAAEVPLFSIIREAFTNIRKHSLADHASLELVSGEEGSSGWHLRIADNGLGLAPGAADKAGRYGLRLIRKQARELGADCVMSGEDGEGLTITLTGRRRERMEGERR
ncbi:MULTISPECIES: sensor histidine kinase [Paenibacillus]|uniref:sensor histidine kinase n=1 Tax=Paenibacillus TaxID=44249 RepID=UPI0022B92A3F|nr:histidine kinase [Paenibacillus caseinilyticus]MCZ8519155.1 histidine kinase [Paenibacillus caseinilyticus]